MKLPPISAGEFFELLRPAAYLLSALLSTFGLASARRRGLPLYVALLIALGIFWLPLVVLPLYLVVLLFIPMPMSPAAGEPESQPAVQATRYGGRLLLPIAYCCLLLAGAAIYFYRDYQSLDAHLARATQAKLGGPPAKIFREYRAALLLEDNPHTHKLLAVELADAGQWPEALNEFQLAERGGEPDESLPFRIGNALEKTGDISRANQEYAGFLDSRLCRQSLPDERCAVARNNKAFGR